MVLAAVTCILVLRLLLRTRLAGLLLDRASARSMHKGAIPRIGGIGMAVGVTLALAALSEPGGFFNGFAEEPERWLTPLAALGAATAAVFAVSLIDDRRSLPALPRLLTHLIAAALLGWHWGLPGWAIPLVSVGMAWSANLYNFMDGSDGLAGGMAVFGYGVLTLAAIRAGEPGIATVACAVTGASAGFLTLNLPPARVFMGDSGSVPLGFAAGALAVLGTAQGTWPAAVPLLAFFPFVFDASLTLARRVARGDRLSTPHREHLYQRAALSGLGHRGVAMAAYVLMAASGIAALAVQNADRTMQALMLLLVCGLHVTCWLAIDRRAPRKPRGG